MAPFVLLIVAFSLLGTTSAPTAARQDAALLDLGAMTLSPDDLAAAITGALARLGEQAAYAVRSSATAEDTMTSSNKTFKRCGCRNQQGKRLEQNCPRLPERGHGSRRRHRRGRCHERDLHRQHGVGNDVDVGKHHRRLRRGRFGCWKRR